MNKQIANLYRQAAIHAATQERLFNADYQEEFAKKLIELTVKECAKNAVRFADSTTIQGLPSKYIENYMLHHFGVTEE